MGLAELNASKMKVQHQFGQDIFLAPRDDLEVQNMMGLHGLLDDLIHNEEYLSVVADAKNERKVIESAINDFKKPENREKYFKKFRDEKLAEMSFVELKQAVAKNKMNRE